jgi:hypothetical protein
VFVHAFLYLRATYAHDFKPEWEEVRVVTGSNKLRDVAEGRMTADELFVHIENGLAAFQQQIAAYFLY